jgi:PAS domain S-box-containing protein
MPGRTAMFVSQPKTPQEFTHLKRSTSHLHLLGLGLAVILLAAVALFSYVSWQISFDSADAIRRVNSSRVDFRALLNDLQWAESNQRGYLLTGEPAALDDYRTAITRIQKRFPSVEQLKRDFPHERLQIDGLRTAIEARLALLEAGVERRKRRPLSPQVDDVDSGRAVMKEIRDLEAEIGRHQQRVIQARRNRIREYARLSQFVTAAACIGILAIVLVSTRRISRLLSDRTRLNQELQYSLEEFLHLANCVPQIVCRFDEAGALNYSNKRWNTVAGGGSTSTAAWHHTLLHPEDRDEFRHRWQEALRSQSSFQTECRLRDVSSGEYHWFLFQASPAYDRHSTHWAWYATFTDIGHQKETERSLQSANEELSQFAYVAAHDLQEPLRNVSLTLGLFRGEYGEQLDGKATELIKEASDDTRRMLAMIKDLLAYSRSLETADGAEPFTDTNETVRQVLMNLGGTIREVDAQLVIETLPPLRVPRPALTHLFQNLIANSLKYRKAGVRPYVSVSASLDGEKCVFSVRDNGIGFDAAYAKRIFGLFKRLHRRDEYPGTGVGLAICTRIVTHFGGHIWAESNPGDGATFYFTLPIARNAEVDGPRTLVTSAVAAAESST